VNWICSHPVHDFDIVFTCVCLYFVAARFFVKQRDNIAGSSEVLLLLPKVVCDAFMSRSEISY